MKTIKVLFENPKYDYITKIDKKSKNKEYFINKWFDMGDGDLKKCIGIEIIQNSG